MPPTSSTFIPTSVRGSNNSDLALLLLIAIGLRLFLSANLLDVFYQYDQPGGNLLLKIHPGTYFLILLAGIALTRPARRIEYEYKISSILMLFMVLIGVVWSVIASTLNLASILIDCYLSAAATFYLMGKISIAARRRVFDLLVALLIVNAFILFFEFFTHIRLLPYRWEREHVWRPTALLAHPLTNGLVYATFVPLVMLYRGSLAVRQFLAAFFVAATFASGARLASLASIVALLLCTAMAFRREPPRGLASQRAYINQIIAIVVSIPIAIIGGISLGLGYRLQSSILDQSAASRINIYRLLNYLTPSEMTYGLGAAVAEDWASRLYGGPFIESPFVAMVVVSGLPFAIIFLMVIVLTVVLFTLRSDNFIKIAAAVFLLVGFSNPQLASKLPVIIFFCGGASAAMALQRSRRTQAYGITALKLASRTRRLIRNLSSVRVS